MDLTKKIAVRQNLERNQNVELFRAIALLLVVLYHCWIQSGGAAIGNIFVDTILPFGGSIGVTAFFVLSGYGIFRSLDKHPVKDLVEFKEYFLHRFHRIAPQYYLSLAVALLLSEGVYFSNAGVGSIISHIFFVHNFSIDWHGSINGALWTMGVTVQFYLIAPILYFFVCRFPIKTMVISVLITTLSRIVIFTAITDQTDPESLRSWMLFIYGRQLISSLDNFVVGMTVSCFATKRGGEEEQKKWICAILAGLVAIFSLCRWGGNYGINSDTLCGYIWHTLLALNLGVILFALHIQRPNNNGGPIKKALLKIARYEYGIYVWHLLIINNLIANSEWMHRLIDSSFKNMAIPILAMVSIAFGVMAEKVVNK